MHNQRRAPVLPGQESVWDYPRPPRIEACASRVRVVIGGVTIADSSNAFRVLETSHPPTYYLPPLDVRTELLGLGTGSSFCEWKGRATYLDAVIGETRHRNVAWSYPDPHPSFRVIRGSVAFFLSRVDAGYVDEEEARPQPGGFYGGWVTSDLAGPFKGEPGTEGW